MDILKRNHVKHGLIMCAVLAVCLLLLEFTNSTFESKSPFISFATFVAPLLVWWSGIRARKKAQKNKLTFKEGIGEGFKISLVFGIVSPFVFLLYYLLFNMDAVAYAQNAYGLGDAPYTVVIAVDMLYACSIYLCSYFWNTIRSYYFIFPQI